MKPESNYSDGPASDDTARPITKASSIGSTQPMASSTPGRCTRMTTMQNLDLSLSSSLAIRENKEQSPSTSPPAVVTPISNTTGVANTSLAQRVPRSLRNIKGRFPVHTSSLEAARSPKGRPKKQVSKEQMTISPKSKMEFLKSEPESPQAEAKASDTPKSEPKTPVTKLPKAEPKSPNLEPELPIVKSEFPKAEAKATSNTTPKEQSPSTSPPAVVTPTTNTTGVANTSLAQRVPRSLRHIKGRCPIRPCSVQVARVTRGRPNKQVSKEQMTKSPKSEPGHPKSEPEFTKSEPESPQAEEKASDTPKQEPEGTLRAQKRQYSPEEAISEQASTSAKATRANIAISPSPRLPYQLYQVNMRNCPVGLLILNLDQQLGPNAVTAANHCQENPSRVTEPTLPVIEINAMETPAIENPYRSTTEPIPEKEAPKTKNCLIM